MNKLPMENVRAIWHDRGEDAPVLKNVGDRSYRRLTIELYRVS